MSERHNVVRPRTRRGLGDGTLAEAGARFESYVRAAMTE